MYRILYNIRDKRADWARSRDERCVNRIYRAGPPYPLG
nr:MAG TPA: hypothetical protein [Caudoviricetes sp.]